MYRIHLEDNEIPFSSQVPQDPFTLWKAFGGLESQCLLSPEAREWEWSLFICEITIAFKKISLSLCLPLLPSFPPISLSSVSSYLALSVSSLFLFLSIREIHQISQDIWHPEAISFISSLIHTHSLPGRTAGESPINFILWMWHLRLSYLPKVA